MNHFSRMQNIIKNIGITGVMQIISLVLSFVSRTIFVNTLGNDYLSCEGLFSNILMLLSFTELGIGSAIIFSLYQPIVDNDYVQIGKLLRFFRNAYNYITILIGLIGISILPFLKFLIKDVPDVQENIIFLYLLFLTNTISSYIFSYKRVFLIANQENYILILIQQEVNVARIIIQSIILIITRNYVLYLVIMIICTLLSNIIGVIYINKKYPWINKYIDNKLTSKEKKEILLNVVPILKYKFGSVILNGTDNIIIAFLFKTSDVGLYANYYIIISAINTIINQVCSGIQASIGNYNLTSNLESKESTFKYLYFISYWVFGFCSISLGVLLTPFVGDVWLGVHYILPNTVVIALAISFYVTALNNIPSLYRLSSGLFKETKNYPIYAAFLNIILSIILGKYVGLAGVFLATAIARGLNYSIVDSYYIYKKIFKKNPTTFYLKNILYFVVYLCNYLITYKMVSILEIEGVKGFVLKMSLCVICSNFIFLICYFRTKIFTEIIEVVSERLIKNKDVFKS